MRARQRPPTTRNITAPSGGYIPATATQTAGPGQSGASSGFSSLVSGGNPNPPGINAGPSTVPENPAFAPTPSTTQPSSGTNIFQNGSGLTGGQNLPPRNTANATSPIPIQTTYLDPVQGRQVLPSITPALANFLALLSQRRM